MLGSGLLDGRLIKSVSVPRHTCVRVLSTRLIRAYKMYYIVHRGGRRLGFSSSLKSMRWMSVCERKWFSRWLTRFSFISDERFHTLASSVLIKDTLWRSQIHRFVISPANGHSFIPSNTYESWLGWGIFRVLTTNICATRRKYKEQSAARIATASRNHCLVHSTRVLLPYTLFTIYHIWVHVYWPISIS